MDDESKPRIVPSLGRIGFLLAAIPWALLLLGRAFGVAPISFTENLAIMLMACAPLGVVISVAGLIGEHWTLWAVGGVIVGLLNTVIGSVAFRR